MPLLRPSPFWDAQCWLCVCPHLWPAPARSLLSSGWDGCSFSRDENWQIAPWRGLFFASVGAGLLAVSVGQAILARMALRGNLLPLVLSLCLALLWWGWRQRSCWLISMAGACAGLLSYTYLPARFTPFLFLLGLSLGGQDPVSL